MSRSTVVSLFLVCLVIGAFAFAGDINEQAWLGAALASPELLIEGQRPDGDSLASAELVGALVTAVAVEGPADRAGLRPGDVIQIFAGRTVTSPSDLTSFLAQMPPVWVDCQFSRRGEIRNALIHLLPKSQADAHSMVRTAFVGLVPIEALEDVVSQARARWDKENSMG